MTQHEHFEFVGDIIDPPERVLFLSDRRGFGAIRPNDDSVEFFAHPEVGLQVTDDYNASPGNLKSLDDLHPTLQPPAAGKNDLPFRGTAKPPGESALNDRAVEPAERAAMPWCKMNATI
ncbi:hypothetical protein [Mesorhizobium hawassense]|uniref:hypothetical protein n=1 Tax=Mesorhizobium hawassense TaxID=1209954 RepID=UPI00142E7FA4|nr:hypothetical protein [Mesorhizobium hawassense]